MFRLLIALATVVSLLRGAPLRAAEVARGELAVLGLKSKVERHPVKAATGIASGA